MQLRLLGPLDIGGVEGPLVLTGRKSRALLAYLALRKGVAVPRETLTALLWSDRSDEQARASLRQTLSTMRKELGAEASGLLTASGHSLTLLNGECWVDTDVLEHALREPSSADLEATAELFRGDLLEGLALGEPVFDQWLNAEREAVRARMLQIWSRLIAWLEGQHRIEDAITHCARSLAMDPLQERVHRTLMALYLKQGRPDAALNQFEQCRRHLATELQAHPAQETLDMLSAIQTRRRQSLPQPTSGQPAEHRPMDAPPSTGPGQPVRPELPEKPSIAVLPFTNMSADPEQGYFSDGITEDIITELGRYSEIFVISRNSSFAFRNAGVDAREIGQRLGVHYLLEGSVRKVSHRIRVTAQLTNAATATQVWADRYDRELLDVFDIQDELTRSIVSTVKGRVDMEGATRAAMKPTGSLSAYECVLRGQSLVHRFTQDSLEAARHLFAIAINLDPRFARAYGWLAYVESYDDLYWRMSASQLEAPVRTAEAGLALDGNDSRCHLALGYACLFRKEFERALHHLNKASVLNPNDDHIMIEMGRYRMYVNEPEEGASHVRRAMRQNPFHPNWYWNLLARCLHTAKDYTGAIAALERLENLHYWHHAYLAACFAQLGDTDRAASHASSVLAIKPDFSLRQFRLVHPYRDAGVLDEFFIGFHKAGLPA